MATIRDFLGPFQILRLVRSGSTCQVWEALQSSDRKRVALKVLLQEFRSNKYEIEQLMHEAAVGKPLKHDNVIEIFDYYIEHGIPFVAMELCNARNLKIELRERPDIIATKMKDILLQCAEGLNYLHEQGWVHCDVKPDNFLVDEEGNVKLIDFSIAERAKKGGIGSLFGKKTVRGTRSYMAPEQIRKKSVDRRTDIYGLGCMVFEMIAGKTPYTATNPDDLLRLHLSAPIPNLTASGSTRELAALVAGMIAKDPAARPQNLRDVILEINKISIYRAGYRPVPKTKNPE